MFALRSSSLEKGKPGYSWIDTATQAEIATGSKKGPDSSRDPGWTKKIKQLELFTGLSFLMIIAFIFLFQGTEGMKVTQAITFLVLVSSLAALVVTLVTLRSQTYRVGRRVCTEAARAMDRGGVRYDPDMTSMDARHIFPTIVGIGLVSRALAQFSARQWSVAYDIGWFDQPVPPRQRCRAFHRICDGLVQYRIDESGSQYGTYAINVMPYESVAMNVPFDRLDQVGVDSALSSFVGFMYGQLSPLREQLFINPGSHGDSMVYVVAVSGVPHGSDLMSGYRFVWCDIDTEYGPRRVPVLIAVAQDVNKAVYDCAIKGIGVEPAQPINSVILDSWSDSDDITTYTGKFYKRGDVSDSEQEM